METKTKELICKEAMEEFDRAEKAQKGRDKSNGLLYSLDDEEIRDYLENQCVDCHLNPIRILVKNEARHILYKALSSLPATQKRRICLRFWEQKGYSEIARLEGVDESAVRRSVERGLAQLKKKLMGIGISAGDFAKPFPIRYVKHFHPKKETADRQNKNASLININGDSQKSEAFWGEEAQ